MLMQSFYKRTLVATAQYRWCRVLQRADSAQVIVTFAAGRHACVVDIVRVYVLPITLITINDGCVIAHLVLGTESVEWLEWFTTFRADCTDPVTVGAKLPVHRVHRLLVVLVFTFENVETIVSTA